MIKLIIVIVIWIGQFPNLVCEFLRPIFSVLGDVKVVASGSPCCQSAQMRSQEETGPAPSDGQGQMH